MTQDALASQLGVSAQAVSKWEKNITAPDISLLPEIAEVFAVTTDELLSAGRHKTPSGYKHYRNRLLAIYEEGGSEQDFRKDAKAYEDMILHGDPDTDDYLMYGYLYNCRARRDMDSLAKCSNDQETVKVLLRVVPHFVMDPGFVRRNEAFFLIESLSSLQIKSQAKKLKKFAGREMAAQKGRRIAPTCARYGKRGYDSLSSSEGERKAFTRP